MARIRRVIHGASKHIQQTTVVQHAGCLAHVSVQRLRRSAFQLRDSGNADALQITRNRWPNARNHLQLRMGFLCFRLARHTEISPGGGTHAWHILLHTVATNTIPWHPAADGRKFDAMLSLTFSGFLQTLQGNWQPLAYLRANQQTKQGGKKPLENNSMHDLCFT